MPRLDGTALDVAKVVAALCMVVDHVNAILLGGDVVGMTLVGRATFPLFCYAVAVALLKMEDAGSRDDRLARYAGRMLLAAALTQPLYQMTYGDAQANVLFTLAAGAVIAVLIRRAPYAWLPHALFAFAIFSHLLPSRIEFGLAGIFLPAALLLAFQGVRGAGFWVLALLLTVNMQAVFEKLESGSLSLLLGEVALLGFFTIVPPLSVLRFAAYVRGQGRLLPKYALYIFYPGHLALLGLAAFFFSG